MLSVASCSGTGIRKRRNDSDYDSSENSGLKIPRGGFYVVLESESDVTASEEDTESISSIQNKSTDFAKDTSDTCSKTSHSDFECLAGVEYEVMSVSDHDNPFDDSCSSSTDSVVWKKTISGEDSRDGDEQAVWADGSSAASDPGSTDRIKIVPQHRCMKCKASTYLTPYCPHCHKVRKDVFPPRPKKRRKKSLKDFLKKKNCTNETLKLPLNDVKNDTWVESSSSQELTLTPNVNALGGSEGLCSICFKNPKNGAFLHCRWVHIYACYQCSLKIWFSTKCCPLCNSKIRQVVKVAIG